MKVKEIYVSHTGLIDVGRYALFVNLDRFGVFIDNDEIVQQAINFNRVVFLGEPLDQKEDFSKICKKINTQNPKTIIEIHTSGQIKPVGLSSINNLIFYVTLKLKIEGKEYKQRINPTIINWFNQYGSYFIFNINNENEVDEANTITNDHAISKKDIYFTFDSYDLFDNVKQWSKQNRYNFAPNFKNLLWKNDGKS